MTPAFFLMGCGLSSNNVYGRITAGGKRGLSIKWLYNRMEKESKTDKVQQHTILSLSLKLISEPSEIAQMYTGCIYI